VGSLEEREVGVSWWGEEVEVEVEGAMGAYVLEAGAGSTGPGAACWAGAGGLATTVVMVACGRRCEKAMGRG
jgi:cysteine synthase